MLSNLQHYTSQMIYPDNTMRNWQGYEPKVEGISFESLLTLCDPQTSGGLLVCVDPEHKDAFEDTAKKSNHEIVEIGQLRLADAKVVYVL